MRANVMNERQFCYSVAKLARDLGWLVAHVTIPLWGARGLPDLIMVHKGQRRIVFAELKIRGKLTSEQAEWLSAVEEAGCEAYIWTPADAQQIAECLAGVAGCGRGKAKGDRNAANATQAEDTMGACRRFRAKGKAKRGAG